MSARPAGRRRRRPWPVTRTGPETATAAVPVEVSPPAREGAGGAARGGGSGADGGAGEPVVLAHAGVTDRRIWDAAVPALVAAGYRAIRYDMPGYGLSPRPS